MKRISILLLTALSTLTLSAQTYIWLGGEMLQSISAGEIRFSKLPVQNFSTPGDVKQLNNSLYHILGEDKSYRNRLACGYQGYNTDTEHNLKNSGTANYAIYSITTESSDLSTTNGRDPWNYLAKLVYQANMIIDGITTHCDTTKASYAYYLGEALFLRAFALSEMIKLWGDVPANWKMFNSHLIPCEPKQDRNLLYEQARADLLRAANLLPWSMEITSVSVSDKYKEPTSELAQQDLYMEHYSATNNTGAPSKAAALALLARIDLNYAGYALRPNNLGTPADGYGVQLNIPNASKRKALHQEALEACAQIIQKEGAYKLLPDYETVFKNICADVTDYTKSEVIWEIPFNDGIRGQFLQYNCPKSHNALMGLKNNTGGSTNAVGTIVPTLYYDYEPGDKRRDVTFAPFEWLYNTGNDFSSNKDKIQQAFPEVDVTNNEKFLYQKFQMIDHFYLGKYRIEWMARERTGNDDGVNFPILRYADVLLMFCEASLGGVTADAPANTTGLSAQALFNQVRARAGLASKTLTMDNLMHERKLEFAGEYLRKYDLIRWGKLRSVMEAEKQRIEQLNQHIGEYASLSDTVYFKYRLTSDFSYTPDIKGYVLDSVYGLNKGEKGTPAFYNPANGWVRKCIYESESAGRILNNTAYILYDYDNPQCLDNRQLWPIFLFDMQSAPEGYLWNDYDY